MPITLVLGGLRQEDHESEDSLGYTVKRGKKKRFAINPTSAQQLEEN